MRLRLAYPGSFDPLTVAHVAIAERARGVVADRHRRPAVVELVISADPLGKRAADQTPSSLRRQRIARRIAHHGWLGVTVVQDRFVADIARGYDAVVMGADKWAQVHDPAFYDTDEACARAVAELAPAVVFTRAGHDVVGLRPTDVLVPLEPELAIVSASAVRSGRHEWRYDG